MARPEINHPKTTAVQTCRQCGTCCRKGGPALHRDDRPLVEEGLIPADALYTIRAGEPVVDNVTGRRTSAASDIIKIKGIAPGWCCRFLEDPTNRCTLYDRRPLECRALTCWDTAPLVALYERDRLARRDLLEDVAGLWELIADHDRRCAYRTLEAQAGRLACAADRAAALETITGMISYDESLRRLLVENGHAPEGLLDFLLGRPLTASLHAFHIEVERTAGRIYLRHSILA